MRLRSRGVGEGTATTAMAVPFVGTPKLSGHQICQKRQKNKEKKRKEREREREREQIHRDKEKEILR